MRRWLLLLLSLCVVSAFAIADDDKDDAKEKEKNKPYTVAGYRHGISFLKKTNYPETKPLVEGELDFKHYHTYDEMISFLRKWAEKYPKLVELSVAGKSYEGRDIWQVALTNTETGKAIDKPAMLLDANRHSGEVTSAESALWLLNHLLEQYGKDRAITRLIDTKTVYFRVKNNPDGSEMYLYTAQINRSSVRPHDSDRDGLIDEDPGEDLDGDGFIRQMRVKCDPDSGNYIIDPRDPKGRLMKQVKDGEGDWKIYSEGIDNDGDGKYNEDGIGGLDLHRNYPENWRPDSGLDATERGYTQFGAGEYPMSEPETASLVLFLLEHPNIGVVNSMDTMVPMHLRGPSTSNSDERMYPEDLAYFLAFDKEGMKITGYPWAGDTYNTYMTRRDKDPVYGEPTKPSPLFGHGPDFGYWYYGAIWYGDELWCAGAMKDYDGDGFYDDYDAMRWNDEALGGKGFAPWTKYDHPQLGEVEIGGFNPKFFSQNPPPEYLEEWIKKEAMFNLFLASQMPQIEIGTVDVKKAKTKGEYTVTVEFSNTGKLPTALEQAKLIKIVRPDRVRLEFDKELTKDKKHPAVEIIDPVIRNKDVECGWTAPGRKQTATFTVRLSGIDSAECTVHVLSTRGGHMTKKITIGGK